jgi:heme-degrading monooxygenase HmoA
MKENAMILTIFRSRLNQETRAEYDGFVERTANLAEAQPGFKGHKLFVAEDGERVTLVEFESMEAQRAWSLSREHVQAKLAGRSRFYSEYKIQICTVARESNFRSEAQRRGQRDDTGVPSAAIA